MAFLDNSGDIILDAVLTDTGRMRLARGDGSFRIAKFALGDDEINYASYDKNHASGSAYYDLTILQTPVLEAFTNNTSTMKSKLMTVARQDLLYLPVIRLNHASTNYAGATRNLITRADADAGGTYLLTVDETTRQSLPRNSHEGVIHGDAGHSEQAKTIVFDQGLDTTARTISNANALSAGNPLRETQYIIEVDDRFLKVATPEDGSLAPVSFVDDDQVASYFFSEVSDPAYIQNVGILDDDPKVNNEDSPIRGPAGTRLLFKLRCSEQATNSTYLFTKFGNTNYEAKSGTNYRYIDTTVRVTGFTTGYRVDIPVRLVKLQ